MTDDLVVIIGSAIYRVDPVGRSLQRITESDLSGREMIVIVRTGS